jgi:hypothetical protein
MIPVQFSNPPLRLDSVRLPDDHVPKLEGKVLVRNLSFDKRIYVRYTSDRWDTYDEAAATYVSGDGNMDVFRFEVDLTGSLHNDKVSTDYQVAVQGIIGTSTYWDNNQGRNYDLTVTRRVAEEEEKRDLPVLELGPAHHEGEASPGSDEDEERMAKAVFHAAQTHRPPPLSHDDEEDFDLDADEEEPKFVPPARGRQGSMIPRTKRVVLSQPPPVLPENPFFAFIPLPKGGIPALPETKPASPVPAAAPVASAPASDIMGITLAKVEEPSLGIQRPKSPITPPSAGGPPTATLASIGTTPSSSAFFGGMAHDQYSRFMGPAPPSQDEFGGGRRGSDAPLPQGLAEMTSAPSVVY